ncbi:hypothetical protein AWB64_01552 [Caballeronia sordidicola]|uniref:Uncharacterized protein n=1 Tax=Caballeronia sordidicola TaxID=196367 RepID=A0A158FN50_CABSO|nr:hypothetical protein [Caballeronia sordidicola]SAL21232.1 hypothetical protein AWB64_01552 [Caballeronia sordidicola]
MRIPLSAGVAMLCVSASALAQQPPAFPMRSQNPAQMSIDNAMCYSYANQHTGVIMAKQSQVPQKPQATKPGAVHPVAVAAPLPSAMSPGSGPVGASAAYAASAAYPASAASGTAKSMASTPASASVSPAASAARPGVASDARAVASASSSSTDAPMPALPPPEPPMVQYWRAYSECMTERGYMVK